MFLVVFVTLVISVIGLYAQVVGIQATRIANGQTGLAQTMLIWQSTAAQKAYAMPASNPNNMTGCNMTVMPQASGSLTIPYCTVLVTDQQGASLPAGYNNTAYSFHTLQFQGYVVTYVSATDASGYVVLPDTGGTSVGVTKHDLLQQLSRAPATITYGTVSTAGTLNVAASRTSKTALNYTIPTSIPTGAVAIISAAH